MPDLPTLAALMSALGWAVAHFVWQGALVGVLAWVAMRCVRPEAASARYAVSCGALALCLVAFVLTVVFSLGSTGSGVSAEAGSTALLAGEAPGGATPSRRLPAQGIALFWVLGVSLFTARFLTQWVWARRLRTSRVESPGEPWLRIFEALKAELAVARRVRLLRSGLAEVPMVVGWFSPVVLVPAAAFTSLSPEQLGAVLAHELTHLRRHDHWVNAAQVIIETLLFFHPVVWWLSSSARLEREHCCDDVAVRSSGHPRILAEALAHLESLRQTKPKVALAANGGSLMNRITRILDTRSQNLVPSTTWRTVTALSAGVLLAAGGLAHAAAPKEQPNDPVIKQILAEAVRAGMPTDQARTIYDTMVFRGSQMEQKMIAELAMIAEEIGKAVGSGRITAEEGEKKLEAMRRRMTQAADYSFASQILGKTKADFELDVTRTQMREAVAAGKISQEDADKRLEAMTIELEARDASGAAMRERYEAEATEIKALVEAGKLTREQAEERFIAMRQRMEQDPGKAETKKPDRAVLRQQIDAALGAGKLTPEQADQMLRGMKEKMAASEKNDRGGDDRWKKVAGALVEAGIPKDKVREVLGGIERVTHELKTEGEDFELNPGVLEYLQGLGLNREQVETVIGFSRRLAGDSGGD